MEISIRGLTIRKDWGLVNEVRRCLCGGEDLSPKRGYQHIQPGDWSLLECRQCRTSFLFPLPDSHTLGGYYDEEYYGKGESKFLGPIETLSRIFRYVRARLVKKICHRGRILDVGCGRAVMLGVLKRWGYEVDGIELDTVAALRAEKEIGQRVYRSLEEIASGKNRQYDVISFWHALEHFPDPCVVLKKVHGLLAEGGYLIIAAPNFASVQASLSGKDWLHLDLPRHLVHFDMSSLAQILQRSGYRVIVHSHFSQEYNPIDTLCFVYNLIGFGNLYPYKALTSFHHKRVHQEESFLKVVLFFILLVPFTILASIWANLFSCLGSGSTSTLVLQKIADLDN